MLHILHRMLQRPQHVQSTRRTCNEFLRAAFPAISRRSIVFIVSDFISTAPWTDAMAQLAQRHEVLAVRLYDPLENELPDLGLLTMQDAETGEQLFVDTHDRGFRKRFVKAAEEREEALRTAFRHAGVDALELCTDDDLADTILRFADMRKRRSRLSAGAVTAARAQPCHDVPLARAAVAAGAGAGRRRRVLFCCCAASKACRPLREPRDDPGRDGVGHGFAATSRRSCS